jgi:hypothetical protein
VAPRVGFGEGVEDELDSVCEVTGQDRQQVLESVTALKDAAAFYGEIAATLTQVREESLHD